MKKIIVAILLILLCSMPLAYAEPPNVAAKDMKEHATKPDPKVEKQQQLLQAIGDARDKIDALKYRILVAQQQYNNLIKQYNATIKEKK